jgi:hypothetical protein
MRFTILLLITIVAFSGCKKDKFTTEPQLTFKKFVPNQGDNHQNQTNQPHLILELTDANGDVGFNAGKDTSKVYIRNILTNKLDSFLLPNLSSAAGKNFKGDLQLGLFSVMGGRNLPSTQRPYVDTLHFEVYVTDFAKHKSNVLVTTEPFYYFTLP